MKSIIIVALAMALLAGTAAAEEHQWEGNNEMLRLQRETVDLLERQERRARDEEIKRTLQEVKRMQLEREAREQQQRNQ